MKATLRKMGNSQGILIPKAIVSQLDIQDELEMTVEDGAIVLRKPRKESRSDWAEASRKIAAAGDDGLVWPEFANADDQELSW